MPAAAAAHEFIRPCLCAEPAPPQPQERRPSGRLRYSHQVPHECHRLHLVPPVLGSPSDSLDVMCADEDLVLGEVGGGAEVGEVGPHRRAVPGERCLDVHVLDDVNAAAPQHRREEQLEAGDLVFRPMVPIVDYDVGKILGGIGLLQRIDHRWVGCVGLHCPHVPAREGTVPFQDRPELLIGPEILVDADDLTQREVFRPQREGGTAADADLEHVRRERQVQQHALVGGKVVVPAARLVPRPADAKLEERPDLVQGHATGQELSSSLFLLLVPTPCCTRSAPSG
mmetsp:Transcript_93943/g.293596  ORF Transcript_93943/g.293596 Transcript_93943/m.293596 type:complete len:284 (+) Transcript_93943:1-852(+)